MSGIHERLPEVATPVTLLWGMRDRVFQPVFLEQWRELLPHARIVELDDAAHFVVEDRPDAVVTAASELAGAR
jgi:cis-3-alkyl-4-acyloxetan-2-one decarboxylase